MSTLSDHIQSRDTGRTLSLPRWAAFALYASRLLGAPIFIMPMLFMSVAAYAALRPPVLLVPALLALVALAILPLITLISYSHMRAAGILQDYLSLLAADTSFGRFLTQRFGYTAN